MRFNKKYLWMPVLLMALLAGSCKKWDDHTNTPDAALGKDLFQLISEHSNLSTFAGLLTKTGYDKIIASSKTFTVFAPVNAALSSLDAAIINDTAKLKKFVGNHIATQSYFTAAADTMLRIAMLNGKYNNMLKTKLEDATITEVDRYAKNGVLQVVDKMIPALSNTWEVLESNPLVPSKQKAYLLSLYRNVFDSVNAQQVGVDPTTGTPVYKPGTDSVQVNIFWNKVFDLRNEGKEFTLFLMADDAWENELATYAPYYKTGTADSTKELSSWEVVKDLAIDKAYNQAVIPDTVVSKFSVKVPIAKSEIIQTIKTSNGVVYIMKKAPVLPKNKLKSFIIEAENYRVTSHERRGNTYFRERINTITGNNFKDVLVSGHGVAQFNIGYRISGVNSTKYKAYWVAVNDFQTAAFTQKLGIEFASSAKLPYVSVAPNEYGEIYLGEFTLDTYYSTLDIFLTAANSTSAAVNPLVCDYIRLEPAF